jgi:hypothetical protein
VRHLGEVGVARVTEDVLAQCNGQHRFFRAQRLRLEDVPQVDGLAIGIRDFDSHDGFARQRGNDPNRQGAKCEGEVVGEGHDPVDLDARRGLELVHRDHRAWVHGHAFSTDAEILEFLFEDPRVHDQAVAIVLVGAFGRALKHADVG